MTPYKELLEAIKRSEENINKLQNNNDDRSMCIALAWDENNQPIDFLEIRIVRKKLKGDETNERIR